MSVIGAEDGDEVELRIKFNSDLMTVHNIRCSCRRRLPNLTQWKRV